MIDLCSLTWGARSVESTIRRPLAIGLLFFSSVAQLACDPFHVEFDAVEAAELYSSAKLKATGDYNGTLKVMTYNVKFGGGRLDFFFDCHGDRVLMTEGEVLENLKRIAKIIKATDPDILFLQEVDVNSKRSAYVDQLQWLLDHTQLNHGAYASQWRADFVPSDGIGPVDSGNAILSRWPLVEATRYALPLREDQSAVVQYFYLRRNILEATVTPEAPSTPGSSPAKVKKTPVHLVVIHAEAYSPDGTKREHVETFEAHLDAAAKKGVVIAGGDLNALPPGTKKLSNFPDSVCTEEYLADDFTDETKWLEGIYDEYEAAIPLTDYQADNTPYFSHTTAKEGFWNRSLDHLFSNQPMTDGKVLQNEIGGIEAMTASDHAPLVVNVEVAQ